MKKIIYLTALCFFSFRAKLLFAQVFINGPLLVCPGQEAVYSTNNASCNYTWFVSKGAEKITDFGTHILVKWSDSNVEDDVVITAILKAYDCTGVPEPRRAELKVRVKSLLSLKPVFSRVSNYNIPCGVASEVIIDYNVVYYSNPRLGEAPFYEWTIPAGWKGPSGETGTFLTPYNGYIKITTDLNTAGEIKMRAVGSGCLDIYSSYRTITINRTAPTITLNGPTSLVCGSKDAITYTATSIPGATYTWKIPSGWSGSSTSNTITVTPDGSSVGDVEVTATLTCDGTAVKPSAKKSVLLNSTPSGLTLISYAGYVHRSGARFITCSNSIGFAVTPTDPTWTYKWTYGPGISPSSGSMGSVSAVWLSTKDTYVSSGMTWVQVEVTNACGLKMATFRNDMQYQSAPPDPATYIGGSGFPAPPSIRVGGPCPLFIASGIGYNNANYTDYIWDICDDSSPYAACYGGKYGVEIRYQGSQNIEVVVPRGTILGSKVVRVISRNGCGEKVYNQPISIVYPVYLTAYPNPATTGSLMLEREGSSDSNAWSYTIYDTFGQSVRAGVIEKNQTTIQVDVQGLPKGLYYILAQDGADIHRQYVRVE